jgi:single-strand DNA-binding protein
MTMFETYVTVVGAVISDPIQRTTATGDKWCTFRMAANERRFNRESQTWVDGDKLYVSVKCWRKLAENVPPSVFKGDHVIVNGRLYLNQYEVNGEPKSMVEVDARAVGPDLSRCTALVQRPPRDETPSDGVLTPSTLAA